MSINKTYFGFDNGVTGTLGIIREDNTYSIIKIPVKKELSYTKTKQNITRVDFPILNEYISSYSKSSNVMAIIERPMVNPGRFKATISAIRCLESVLICLELNEIPMRYIDSKSWQKELLPSGLKKEELKKASMDIGCRLFPLYKNLIQKHKDADGILIAEYARRNNL